MAESLGCATLPIASLADSIGSYDIIFNTIPAMVLESGLLEKIKSDSLIIDLASKPGGAGFYLDKVFGIRKRCRKQVPTPFYLLLFFNLQFRISQLQVAVFRDYSVTAVVIYINLLLFLIKLYRVRSVRHGNI